MQVNNNPSVSFKGGIKLLNIAPAQRTDYEKFRSEFAAGIKAADFLTRMGANCLIERVSIYFHDRQKEALAVKFLENLKSKIQFRHNPSLRPQGFREFHMSDRK